MTRLERVTRGAWALAVALAIAHVAGFFAVALLRLRYPYDLEWMEGGQLLHSHEILAGRFPYRAPSPDHIAFPYQPLYPAVVAALAAVFGLSLPLARAVSIVATVACAALIGGAVWKETRSRRCALMAGAMVFALYRVTGFWFNLARVDSLFMALLVGGLYAARYLDGPWVASLTSAVLLVLAYKTKQLALPFFVLVPPLLVAKGSDAAKTARDTSEARGANDARSPSDAGTARGRAAAAAFVGFAAGALGLDFWLSQRASGGWFSFYVNDVPRGQPYLVGLFCRFGLVLALDVPVLLVLAREGAGEALRGGAARPGRSWRSRSRETWSLAAILGVAVTLAAWARPGGAANNLMTTYVLAIVPAFVALHRFDTTGTPKQRAVLFAALAGQLAWLAYDPSKQIPRAADYAAGRELVELLHDAPGPVLVPDRPWLAVLAGKAPSYHANTFWEMSFQNRASLVPDELRRRLATGYYALVVNRSDPHRLVSPLQWWPRELLDHYKCDRSIHLPGRGLAPLTGVIAPGPHVLCTYERVP